MADPFSCPNSLLTMTVRVTMVAWEAAVTVRAIKPRSALATAGLITAFRQGPCRAAATHCRVGCVTEDPDRGRLSLRDPQPPIPT